MKQKRFDGMTNKYSLSKTLRFELKPQYSTLDNIKEHEIVQKDIEFYKKSLRFKEIYDEALKKEIDNALKKVKLKETQLVEFSNLYLKTQNSKEQKDCVEKLAEVSKNLQKDIEQQLEETKNWFTKIKEIEKIKAEQEGEKKRIPWITPLLEYAKNNLEEKDIEIIKDCKEKKTFFKDFLRNRQNIFIIKGKENSIPHRAIEENLRIYINNIEKYKKLIAYVGDDFEKIKNELLSNFPDIKEIFKIFELKNYNNYLTQDQIDNYNLIICGKSIEGNKKIKGFNEIINNYKQIPDNKNKDNIKKIKGFTVLKKQILSDSKTQSFVYEPIENDKDLVEKILKYTKIYKTVIDDMEELFRNINKYDLNHIFITKSNLNSMSNKIFGPYDYISKRYLLWLQEDLENKGKKKKEIDEAKKRKVVSLEEILCCLITDEDKTKFLDYIKNPIQIKDTSAEDISSAIIKLEKIKKEKLLEKDKKDIKNIVDYFMQINCHYRIFSVGGNDEVLEKDEMFYNYFDQFFDEISKIVPLYNKARNYLTKKPYSKVKYQITFGCGTLLDGWSPQYHGALFRKDGLYYLGITNPYVKNSDKILDKEFINERIREEDIEIKNRQNVYTQFIMHQQPNPKADVYRLISWDDDVIKPPYPTKKECKKKCSKGDIEEERKLIDFFIKSIKQNPNFTKYNFKFKNLQEYKGEDDFFKEIERQSYYLEENNIYTEYIKYLVDKNQLFLFQIYSKDFSKYSKGRPNLHTIYFKALFDERNANKYAYSYKLSGGAEMFYRHKSLKLEETCIHKEGDAVVYRHKENTNGRKYQYDIIKDRRFTEDKFFFHLPIKLNRCPEEVKDLNEGINEIVKKTENNYILGIDRGERHLLYLVLIDEKGNIIEQKSLNEIKSAYIYDQDKSQIYKNDYRKLLDDKEKERMKERKNWDVIENIKELKSGYLSHVVSEIVSIILKYNPIIAIENLHPRFVQRRKKIEKQVYKKFEDSLISKLNYLVLKTKGVEEVGGAFKALQLTNDLKNSSNKLQSGIVYKIPARYTSNIDPDTGFYPFLKPRYESIKKSKEFFDKFDDIKYLENEKMFKFKVSYKKFKPNTDYWKDKVWDIYTYGKRIEGFKNQEKNNSWDTREIELTDEFKKFFLKNNINYNENLKHQILQKETKKFFEGLLRLMKLTEQLRNTDGDRDFIISPVKNKEGKFFYSEDQDIQKIGNKPCNADANGAFNIARKGLLVVKNLKNGQKENKAVKIKDEDWFSFVEKMGQK